MSWRVARSLDVLLAELNAAAPNRSKASDGSIGDAAHASRDSDHNPWVTNGGVGIVRARDFTHDPAGGLDCNRLAALLVQLFGRHPAMGSGAYVIWKSRIFSYDRRDEGWRPYSGSNPHTKHLHLSVALASGGYDATAPWGVTGTTEEDYMATSEAEQKLTSIETKLDGLIAAEATRAKAARKIARTLLREAKDNATRRQAQQIIDLLSDDEPEPARKP